MFLYWILTLLAVSRAEKFTYSTEKANYPINIAIVENKPNRVESGSYVIEPHFIGGLLFDNKSGIISGTPIEEIRENFTVVFTNDDGKREIATIEIFVLSKPTHVSSCGFISLKLRSNYNSVFICQCNTYASTWSVTSTPYVSTISIDNKGVLKFRNYEPIENILLTIKCGNIAGDSVESRFNIDYNSNEGINVVVTKSYQFQCGNHIYFQEAGISPVCVWSSLAGFYADQSYEDAFAIWNERMNGWMQEQMVQSFKAVFTGYFEAVDNGVYYFKYTQSMCSWKVVIDDQELFNKLYECLYWDQEEMKSLELVKGFYLITITSFCTELNYGDGNPTKLFLQMKSPSQSSFKEIQFYTNVPGPTTAEPTTTIPSTTEPTTTKPTTLIPTTAEPTTTIPTTAEPTTPEPANKGIKAKVTKAVEFECGQTGELLDESPVVIWDSLNIFADDMDKNAAYSIWDDNMHFWISQNSVIYFKADFNGSFQVETSGVYIFYANQDYVMWKVLVDNTVTIVDRIGGCYFIEQDEPIEISVHLTSGYHSVYIESYFSPLYEYEHFGTYRFELKMKSDVDTEYHDIEFYPEMPTTPTTEQPTTDEPTTTTLAPTTTNSGIKAKITKSAEFECRNLWEVKLQDESPTVIWDSLNIFGADMNKDAAYAIWDERMNSWMSKNSVIYFKAEFNGYFNIEKSGIYSFYANQDYVMWKVLIDNTTIIVDRLDWCYWLVDDAVMVSVHLTSGYHSVSIESYLSPIYYYDEIGTYRFQLKMKNEVDTDYHEIEFYPEMPNTTPGPSTTSQTVTFQLTLSNMTKELSTESIYDIKRGIIMLYSNKTILLTTDDIVIQSKNNYLRQLTAKADLSIHITIPSETNVDAIVNITNSIQENPQELIDAIQKCDTTDTFSTITIEMSTVSVNSVILITAVVLLVVTVIGLGIIFFQKGLRMNRGSPATAETPKLPEI